LIKSLLDVEDLPWLLRLNDLHLLLVLDAHPIEGVELFGIELDLFDRVLCLLILFDAFGLIKSLL
jgi:hypothetical protein